MKRTLSIFSLLILLSPTIWAADDLMSRQMVDQARNWSQKGRDDLAAPVWRRVLSVEPSHPEALVKLGLIEARAGNSKEAQALYQRAIRLLPVPKGLKALSTALNPVDEGLPQEVKVGPKASPSAPSAPSTREVILMDHQHIQKQVGSTPAVEVKRETKEGGEKWSDRRFRLEKAAQDHPGDAQYLLALASHLAERESTRREAIRQLEALNGSKLRPSEIKKPWKKSLLALTPQQGDQPLFKNYLAHHPSSTSVVTRLNVLDGKVPAKEIREKGVKKVKRSNETLIKVAPLSNVTIQPACSNAQCK